jgi:non-ribosomal peptide synthetase component E (peptide arylation enzyme)
MFTGPTEPGILALPQVGGKCVVMETFEPEEALRLVERERITYISGFPILFIRMARVANIKDYDLSSLRFLCYAGAPFPAGAAEEVEAKLGVPILDFYGTLDSGMVFTADPDAPMERRTYRVGRVPPWDEIKVVDEKGNEVPVGEVGVLYWRGATGCGGFFGDPEKTKEAWGTLDMDGWFNTEDLAKVCEEGDVMLAGRARDMILRGGQNIYPLEIVNILSGHPKIADVQIIAMPDPDMGERACTFVVPRKGERFTFDEMISHLTEKNIAKYKLPERLEVMEEFPMVGDKINVRALGGYVAKKLVEEGKIGQDLANSWKEQGRIIL